MEMHSLAQELSGNAYPGRGIVIGTSEDGKYAVSAYFIMGRSSNSRNRVFVTDGEGIRTQAFDPSKLEDPSLIKRLLYDALSFKRKTCHFTLQNIHVSRPFFCYIWLFSGPASRK